MRRRRGSRGVWMPTLGTRFSDAENNILTAQTGDFDDAGVPNDRGVQPLLDFRALTPDFTVDPNEAADTHTLRDKVEGQEWVCKRIVGKVFVQAIGHASSGNQNDPFVHWPLVKVDAGIFVGRADDTDQNLPDYFPEEMTPDLLMNQQDPWMFKRTWLLGNPSFQGSLSNVQGHTTATAVSFNFGNGAGGCIFDGPQIDVKSQRRIPREHRLWFVISARGWFPGTRDTVSASTEQPGVAWTNELRIFGAMRKARGRKTF